MLYMTELEKLGAKYKLFKELVADGKATQEDLNKVRKQIFERINELFAEYAE